MDNPAHIMVVDDEDINLTLYQTILAREGYRVTKAHTGREALQLMEAGCPDLLLLDAMMPEMDGFEVAHTLKESPQTRSIPIIMLTGLSDSESRLKALRSGVEEFLTKPVERPELLVRVRNLLRLKKLYDLVAAHSLHLEDEIAQTTHDLEQVRTELSDTQQRLIQAEKLAAIGQFAAGVSHEINTPISFIKANLNVLEDYFHRFHDAVRYLENTASADVLAEWTPRRTRLELDFISEDIPALLQESREGISHIRRITQELLAFSTRDLKVPMQTIDVVRCMDAALHMALNLHPETSCQIDFQHDAQQVLTQGSSVELTQVFINLLRNALEATAQSDHGQLRISIRQHPDNVVVEVSDNGPGIAPQHLAQIFNPFFTTKPVGGGTGLGLSLAYGLIQRMGGRIEADSQYGHGASFRVILPSQAPA